MWTSNFRNDIHLSVEGRAYTLSVEQVMSASLKGKRKQVSLIPKFKWQMTMKINNMSIKIKHWMNRNIFFKKIQGIIRKVLKIEWYTCISYLILIGLKNGKVVNSIIWICRNLQCLLSNHDIHFTLGEGRFLHGLQKILENHMVLVCLFYNHSDRFRIITKLKHIVINMEQRQFSMKKRWKSYRY